MTTPVSTLHLVLARAARDHGVAVTHWLRAAGSARRESLLERRALEAAGLDAERARRWLDEEEPESAGALARAGWRALTLEAPDYPPLLANLEDAPPVLFVRGDITCLSTPQVALVGSRHASVEGRENAYAFARELARAGFLVTSGLALGVDGAAHDGALAAGRTVAVLGCGPDRVYPARHRPLAERISEQGALVTEFPPQTTPLRRNFPRRNRIISGLSLATVVIEAAPHSGSLITARLAAEQGREVFAVPGSIHNPMSKGCHRLLREGANWLEEMADLLEPLGAMEQLARAADEPATAREPLLEAFTGGLNSVEQLQRRTGLPAAELGRELTRLELEGLVERQPGGYQRAGFCR